MEGDDPGVIRSVAVTAEDVVAALEAREQSGTRVVLRATPPYSGRMRARLHVLDGDDDTQAVTVGPGALLTEDAPRYPRPSETEDELRADPQAEYTVERHRERHERAVAEWREAVANHFVEETTVETPQGPQAVEVTVLG